MRLILSALLCATLGCGSAVSLDRRSPPSDSAEGSGGGSSTDAPSSGDPGTETDSGASPRLDLGGGALDVPPEPLPPGTCPPDCQFELSLVWDYDGPVERPPPVRDPEDRVLVSLDDEGGVVVAEQRQGAVTLARLDAMGQELWTQPLALACDPCQLIGLERHPSGDALLSAHGPDASGDPVTTLARVELGGPSVSWAYALPLSAGPGIVPRVGPLVVLDDALMAQPVIHGSPVDGQERRELFIYELNTGEFIYTDGLATGPATDGAARLHAVSDAQGTIMLGHPVWEESVQQGELSWWEAIGSTLLGSQRLSSPILALARADETRVVALTQTPATGRTTLHLHAGTATTTDRWSATHVLTTDSAPTPTLAVGDGHAYVAARIATGAPGRETDSSVQLLRWSEGGSLVWQIALPIVTDRVDQPLSLQLQDDQQLVLGGFVGGVRHVERRRQTCSCD